MDDPFLPIRKCEWPDHPGPYSKFKHIIPRETLQAMGATERDFFGGRLREAHVLRLKSLYVVYSKNCLLGCGGFGDCYVGRHSSGRYVAVKRLRNFPSTKMDGKPRCGALSEDTRIREYRLAERFGGPLAPMMGLRTGSKSYIVGPLADGDALYAAQVIHVNLVIRKMLRDVLDSLDAMHRQGVIHNDIKPNNVFVLKNDNDLHFCLADFGLSFDPNQDPNPGANIWYGAPEHVLDSRPSCASDIFSLGMACMAIVLGHSPLDAGWGGGKESDMDDEERQRVYASFEAARLGKSYAHASNSVFLSQWRVIEKAHQPFLVDLFRGMVTAADARCPRLSGEVVVKVLKQHPFSDQEMSLWKNRLKYFKIDRIDQAKRQATLVQEALVSRKRLREEAKP